MSANSSGTSIVLLLASVGLIALPLVERSPASAAEVRKPGFLVLKKPSAQASGARMAIERFRATRNSVTKPVTSHSPPSTSNPVRRIGKVQRTPQDERAIALEKIRNGTFGRNTKSASQPVGPARSEGGGSKLPPDKIKTQDLDNRMARSTSVGEARDGASSSTGTRSIGAASGEARSRTTPKPGGAPDNPIQFGQPVGPAATSQTGATGAGSDRRVGSNTSTPRATTTVGPGRGEDGERRVGSGGSSGSGFSGGSERASGDRNRSALNDRDVPRTETRSTGPRISNDDDQPRRSTLQARDGERRDGPSDRSTAQGRTASAATTAALVTGSTDAALTGAKWSHNNSTMRVESQGGTMRVLYDQPKSGLAGLGIAPGTPLFDGKKTGANTYAGAATTFSRLCGPATFPVAGEVSGDGRRLVLRGQKPERGTNCQVSGYRPETLSFEVAR